MRDLDEVGTFALISSMFVRADAGTTVLRRIAPAEVSKVRTGKRFYVNGRAVNVLRAGNRKAVQPTFAK